MKIARLDIYAYRAAVSQTVVSSFATMPTRGMALLRLEDSDGVAGWGEIWGNFPSVTTEYRARLAGWALPPLLLGAEVDAPGAFCAGLTEKLHVLAVQADEPGPVAALVAATSQALWDLTARRAGKSLRHLLSAEPADAVPAYASGMNPGDCIETLARCREEGYRAFKLKVGFGTDVDLANVRALRNGMADGDRLFVDANQKWPLDEAIVQARQLAAFDIGWLEEPLAADRPAAEWQALKAATPLALAGGENLRGMAAFDESLAWLDYVQPDVGKWGGVENCLEIARRARAAGCIYCPHWLAGGIGLLHSANLLAAAGGDGLLEIDSNENPLRTLLLQGLPGLQDGRFVLPDSPGIGVEPPLAELQPMLSEHQHFHQ